MGSDVKIAYHNYLPSSERGLEEAN